MDSDTAALLTGNPYFTAGFGLLGVGSALAVARQGILRAAGFLQRRLISTLEVTSRDSAYPWLLQWITKQPLTSGGHFSLTSRIISHESSPSSPNASQLPFQLVPSPGIHFFRWKGRWLQVRRERERSQLTLNASSSVSSSFSSGPFETLTLTCLAGSRRRGQEFISSILREAYEEAARLEAGKLILWTAFGQEWRPFGQPRRPRALSSVILAAGVKEALLEDVQEFLSASSWYQKRGIPYRRGYLLEGPPGGGKSSLVQAIASELGYRICVLSLSEGWLTDDRFALLLNSLPPKSILLLEDIDATGPSREDSGSKSAAQGRLTFSGLLNALDGVASAEERIIFMTTNHCERLDPALIRPGRVDYRQHIGWASGAQAAEMFANFYPQHRHLAQSFAEAVGTVSPAAIQGHFIRFKNDPMEALEQASSSLKSNLACKINKA